MKTKKLIKRSREVSDPFRVNKGKEFRLKDVDPDNTLEAFSNLFPTQRNGKVLFSFRRIFLIAVR